MATRVLILIQEILSVRTIHDAQELKGILRIDSREELRYLEIEVVVHEVRYSDEISVKGG